MNIIILCGHPSSPYAREVLRALNFHGLERVSVITAAEPSVARNWRAIWNAYGWRLPQVIARHLTQRVTSRAAKMLGREPEKHESLEAMVQAQGGQFFCVPAINSETCRQALLSLNADLMILAGAPIVRKPLLEIPRLGVLNAHQGALPRFRGMNVIEWAILERTQPTLSVHFVDPGVDTGDIIMTVPIPLLEGDTLRKVRLRASAQQPELLAQTAVTLASGSLPRRSQRAEEGRQYFVMHPWLRVIAEQRLQEHFQEALRKKTLSLGGTDVDDTNPHTHPVLVKCAS